MTEGRLNHYSQVQRTLVIVLFFNLAVAIAKVLFGVWSKSSSILADGFHSLTDGVSNVIGLIGVYICSQPKDEDHPYGHKKYEDLFVMLIATMLMITAFNLFKGGITRIFHPVTPVIDINVFIVMIVTVAVNVFVMFYEYRKGKKLGSDILVVDSMHTRTDLFVSLSVIAALIAVKSGFLIIDAIATLVIAVLIAYTAYEMMRHQSAILCDAVAIEDTEKIESIVLGIPGVISCHKIRTRGRPDDIHLDLHVHVDGNMALKDSHAINHIIDITIREAMPQITDILVHMEPEHI